MSSQCGQAQYTFDPGNIGILFSQTNIPPNLSNSIICVKSGQFYIDLPVVFNNVTFIMSGASPLFFGANSVFNNCCFITSDVQWPGIITQSSTSGLLKIEMTGCNIVSARVGISQQASNELTLDIAHTNITDCSDGILLRSIGAPSYIFSSKISKSTSNSSGTGIRVSGATLVLYNSTIENYALGVSSDSQFGFLSSVFSHLNKFNNCGIGIKAIENSTTNVFVDEFNNCLVGISSVRSYLRCVGSEFLNTASGINFTNNFNLGPKFQIANNKILWCKTGINISGCTINISSNIINNEITAISGSGGQVGIKLTNIQSYDGSYVSIVGNIPITTHNNGIEFSNANSNFVHNNNITLLANTPASGSGIKIQNSKNNFFLDNRITNSDTSSMGVGIRTISSNKNYYCCNSINGGSYGILASGTSESFLNRTQFEGNYRTTGLSISGIIGPQVFTSNFWSTLTNNGYDNYGSNWNQSIFTVVTNTLPWHPVNANPPQVVKVLSGPSGNCGSNEDCDLVWDPKMRFVGLTSLDDFAIDSTYLGSDGLYLTDWTKRLLFDVYYQDPTANYGVAIENYIQDLNNEEYALCSELKSNFEASFYENTNSALIETTYSEYISNIEELADVFNSNPSNYNLIFDQIAINNLNLSMLDYLDEITIYSAQVSQNLLNIQTYYSGIAGNKVWAQVEKEFYPIFIDYLRNGLISTSQMSTLIALNEICPTQGGEVIYLIREFLNTLGIPASSNEVCDSNSQQIKSNSKILPNPIYNNELVIESEKVEIYNMQGIKIFDGKLHKFEDLNQMFLRGQVIIIKYSNNKVTKHVIF